MLTRVLLTGAAAAVGYLALSLAAEPALADEPEPAPSFSAELPVPALLEGGALGATVESTVAGLLPTGANDGDQPPPDQPPPDQPPPDQADTDQPDTDQPDTDQPDTDQPDPVRATEPGPPPSESDDGRPAAPAPDPAPRLLEPSTLPEVAEPLAVVEEVAPRAAEAAGALVEPLGESVDAVSTTVTRLSCDEPAERELPRLCLPDLQEPGLGLPGLGLPDLGLPGLGLPEVGLPEPELPGPGESAPGQGPAPPEPRGPLVDGRAVTVAAAAPVPGSPGPAAVALTGDLVNGPPAAAAPTPIAATSLAPQSALAPLSPPVATATGSAAAGGPGLTIRGWPGHPDATLGSCSGDSGGTSACCAPVPEAPVLRAGGACAPGGFTSPTRAESVPAPPG